MGLIARMRIRSAALVKQFSLNPFHFFTFAHVPFRPARVFVIYDITKALLSECLPLERN